MRIVKCLGATKEEIENKKFNIVIGVSLGNKYFTKENINQYILWALDYTKEDILVLIPDRIQAINIEALGDYKKLRAFRVAIRKGDEKEDEVKEILAALPQEKQKTIKIARWREVTGSKYHDYRIEVLFDEFRKKGDFYDYIISIVKQNCKNTPHTLKIERLEKLAEYILYEIPVFINGFKYGFYKRIPKKEEKKYNLIIYPGLNDFDNLIIGLQNGTLFPDLSKKLKINDKIIIVEGFVD